MIIAKLMGGNGNQMFQYAAGFALARKHNTELLLDINYILDKRRRHFRHTNRDYALGMFNISGKIASSEEISRFTTPRKGNKYVYHLKRRFQSAHNCFRECEFSSCDRLQELPADAYIEGYWQNPEYFKNVEKGIRSEFTFKNEVPDRCAQILNRIRTAKPICVIFRRGDFVNHPVLDVVGLDFYHAALKLINNQLGVSKAKVFVFSDDIPWCRRRFRPRNVEVQFVDQDLTGPIAEYYFQMITACSHYIIPNSTFAWWGAWLSESPGKIVIAPRRWWKGQVDSVNSIIPSDWITI